MGTARTAKLEIRSSKLAPSEISEGLLGYNLVMKDKRKPSHSAVANGEQLKPTPELQEMIRKRFPPEGKAERVARSLAALESLKKLPPTNLTPEELKIIAEDKDLEYY